ncbi:MAG: cache domain-containing protein [Bacteroidales bacterium]
MKNKLTCLIISLALFSGGCKKDVLELPEALTTSKTNLVSAFESLNSRMAAAANYLVSVNMDTILIRAKMLELVNGASNIEEFSWVTPQGILKIIEPSIYYGSQGADISQQDHIIKAFETKKPVLSQQFLAVEGFYAAVDVHPILDNQTVLGGITALFITEAFLADIMEPLLLGQDFELWVMEKGGRMLYNQDAYEIGLNLFTDPLYKVFPELITAAGKIDTEESGTTHYSFYKTGTSEPVTKLTYWTTFELYGAQWKLVWVKPE